MTKCISCRTCGHIGWSKPRGNFLVTIVLAFLFILPALLYEIWRRTSLGICESCASKMVVPSHACVANKPSNLDSILVFFVLSSASIVVLILIYTFFNTLLHQGRT